MTTKLVTALFSLQRNNFTGTFIRSGQFIWDSFIISYSSFGSDGA